MGNSFTSFLVYPSTVSSGEQKWTFKSILITSAGVWGAVFEYISVLCFLHRSFSTVNVLRCKGHVSWTHSVTSDVSCLFLQLQYVSILLRPLQAVVAQTLLMVSLWKESLAHMEFHSVA